MPPSESDASPSEPRSKSKPSSSKASNEAEKSSASDKSRAASKSMPSANSSSKSASPSISRTSSAGAKSAPMSIISSSPSIGALNRFLIETAFSFASRSPIEFRSNSASANDAESSVSTKTSRSFMRKSMRLGSDCIEFFNKSAA